MSHEFQEAGWATEGFRPVAGGRTVAMFYAKQVKMEKASIDAGRPVFKEVIHIKKIPADMYLVVDRPVRESDKAEYAREWEQWEKTKETRVLGMPIDHWPAITDTQKAEFKAMKIYTIEQFAQMPDAVISGIMGGIDLRNKARVYVESGRDADLISRIRQEAEMKVSELEEKLAKLTAVVEGMDTKKAMA